MAVRKKHATGFTIVELMVVLAIASAILLIAVPMFRTQVQNSRMSAAATDLLSTFMYAKSEAIGRRIPVSVCIRNIDGDACADTGQWEDGWLTFVDLNGDGALDDGEDIIQIHRPLPEGLFASGAAEIANSITYRPNGRTNLTATRALIICDGRTGYTRADDPDSTDSDRALMITILGKASVMKAEDTAETKCLPTS